MADKTVYGYGVRLKESRKKRKLTQKEVAARLDCSVNTIRHYEDNSQSPPIENLVRLAIMYNVSVDYILGLSDRTYLYIDDLSVKQQKFLLNMLEQVRDVFVDS